MQQQRKEKETSIPLQKNSGYQNWRPSHPSKLLKVEERGTLVGAEDQIEELVGGQNPGPEALPMSKKGQERKKQRKCQERSDCGRSSTEELVCQGH